MQLPILREMDHVLKKTYFSRSRTIVFLSGLFQTQKLVGDDPCAFWRGVEFLDIQGGGASQKEMLALFSKVLRTKCEIETSDCFTQNATYIYLDDATFTGNRVKNDLEGWIVNTAPTHATVHVITMALHEGYYYAKNKIQEAATRAGKNIKVEWWSEIILEDRKVNTANSDVLRSVSIPEIDEVQAYVGRMRYPPTLRTPGQVGKNEIFSSDAGRQVLEIELLKAGVRIRNICPHLHHYQRPLGNMVLDTLGFGSMIVTFRNCPNNAPLALWAGDPWTPLFPRSTNSDTAMRNLMTALDSDVF